MQVTVTYYNASSVSSVQPTTKVVSSGTVVAPGYDPIVIYKIINPEVQKGDGNTQAYIPTLPTIVSPNSSSIISRRPSGGNQVVEKTDSTNQSILIIVAAVGTLCAIVLCYALRVLYVHLNAEEYRLEELKQRKEMREEGKGDNELAAGIPVIEITGANTAVDASAAMHTQMKLKDEYITNPARTDDAEDKEYEEQYNPAADFAIFGKGDHRGGAMQTWQEKMNLADDVDDKASSASDDGNEVSSAVKERSKKSKARKPAVDKLTI